MAGRRGAVKTISYEKNICKNRLDDGGLSADRRGGHGCQKTFESEYECRENDNSVDNIRPHRVYFALNELSNVCKVLATNTANCNGFDIV